MTKKILGILFVALAHLGFTQVTLTIADPAYSQTNPLNCAGIVPTGGTNFIDGLNGLVLGYYLIVLSFLLINNFLTLPFYSDVKIVLFFLA